MSVRLTPKDIHKRGLAALQLLNTSEDLIEKESAFIELRDSVYSEISTITDSELASGTFDLCEIEWKCRMLEELSFSLPAEWSAVNLALWKWSVNVGYSLFVSCYHGILRILTERIHAIT